MAKTPVGQRDLLSVYRLGAAVGQLALHHQATGLRQPAKAMINGQLRLFPVTGTTRLLNSLHETVSGLASEHF